MILASPITVMKLASPDQRGTTCMCRCSASEPPAGRPRFSPTLNPSGRETAFITRIERWVKSISSADSSAVSSSSSATRR